VEEYFQNKNKIIIEFVGNGIIVEIPDRTVVTEEYDEYLLKREAHRQRIFTNEAQSDDELRNLQGFERPQPISKAKQFKKLSVSEISDKTTYTFKTLPEVLKFLEDEFKD